MEKPQADSRTPISTPRLAIHIDFHAQPNRAYIDLTGNSEATLRFDATVQRNLQPRTASTWSDLNHQPRNGGGESSFANVHQPIIVVEDETEEEEYGLSLTQVKSAGHRRLRPIQCQWHDGVPSVSGSGSNSGTRSTEIHEDEEANASVQCNAILGSYALYKKHLRIHSQRAVAAAQHHVQPGQIFLDIKCGWKACPASKFLTADQLQDHYEKAHLIPLRDTYCPFKDCENPSLSRYEYNSLDHYQDEPGHPFVLTPDVLRPDPVRLLLNATPKEPSPISPTLQWDLNSFLTTVLPYQGDRNDPTDARNRKSRSGSPRYPVTYDTRIIGSTKLRAALPPLPLAQVRNLILPQPRRGTEFFEPFCNDAPSGCHSRSLSYSIFQHPYFRPEVCEDEVEVKGKIYNLAAILRGESKKDALRVISGQSTSGGMSLTREALSEVLEQINPAKSLTLSQSIDMANSSTSSPLDDLTAPQSCAPSVSTLVPHRRPSRPWAAIKGDARSYVAHCQSLISARKRKRREEKERREEREKKKVELEGGGDGDQAASGDLATVLIPRIVVTSAPLDPATITRAAKRHAAKLAGRSYGAIYERELYTFLKRGQELGELL